MAKIKKSNNDKTPGISVSFRKCMVVSDGTMEDVKLFLRKMRTTMSEDAAGGSGENSNNLQTTEKAIATVDKTVINFKFKPVKIKGSLVQGNIMDKLVTIFEEIYQDQDFEKFLEKNAESIAYNILQGKWMWRNREIALTADVKVDVKNKNDNIIDTIEVEDVIEIPYIDFDENFKIKYPNTDFETKTKKLSEYILKAFKNEMNLYLDITGTISTFAGTEVHPSQLFVDNINLIKKIIKDRYNEDFHAKNPDTRVKLYYKEVITDKPAITAEKLGNALRTYDVWYNDYPIFKKPISIEITGGNLATQSFPRKRIFRDILKELVEDKKFNQLTDQDKMYFVACLIRGGVPVESKKNK